MREQKARQHRREATERLQHAQVLKYTSGNTKIELHAWQLAVSPQAKHLEACGDTANIKWQCGGGSVVLKSPGAHVCFTTV